MRIIPITFAAAVVVIAAGCNSTSKTAQAKPPTTVERVPIKYQPADAVAAQLAVATPHAQPAVRIMLDAYTNCVIISGTPEQVEQLQRQIATIDVEG